MILEHALLRVRPGLHRRVTTTITVSSELGDRLKTQAQAENRTLDEHLAHLASLGDRAARFTALRVAIDATPSKDLISYRQERAAWESMDA